MECNLSGLLTNKTAETNKSLNSSLINLGNNFNRIHQLIFLKVDLARDLKEALELLVLDKKHQDKN